MGSYSAHSPLGSFQGCGQPASGSEFSSMVSRLQMQLDLGRVLVVTEYAKKNSKPAPQWWSPKTTGENNYSTRNV